MQKLCPIIFLLLTPFLGFSQSSNDSLLLGKLIIWIYTLEQEEVFDKIEILNINGQLVFEKEVLSVNYTTIDIFEIPNGIYFIKVFSNDNVNVQKIIKN